MKETPAQKRARIIEEQAARQKVEDAERPAPRNEPRSRPKPRSFPRWPGAAGSPGARKPTESPGSGS